MMADEDKTELPTGRRLQKALEEGQVARSVDLSAAVITVGVMGLLLYMLGAEWRHLACIPFIYSLIFPMLLLDVALTVYQWVCFPLFRIQKVPRSDCWVFDRSHLAYLNALEKLNCAYCSYGNGLAAYFAEIASRTEQYWCPIKHSRRMPHAHARYPHFVDFGDAENFQTELQTLREQLRVIEDKQDAELDPQGPMDSPARPGNDEKGR